MLLRFTNPSKRSTFNVRLVPDKNFRMIAPTVFPVGVSTNWLKFLSTIAHIFLNFTANCTKFCGDGLGSATCAPNFIEIGAQQHRLRTLLLFGAKKKKKNTKKIRRVSGTCISGIAGAISFKFGM